MYFSLNFCWLFLTLNLFWFKLKRPNWKSNLPTCTQPYKRSRIAQTEKEIETEEWTNKSNADKNNIWNFFFSEWIPRWQNARRNVTIDLTFFPHILYFLFNHQWSYLLSRAPSTCSWHAESNKEEKLKPGWPKNYAIYLLAPKIFRLKSLR